MFLINYHQEVQVDIIITIFIQNLILLSILDSFLIYLFMWYKFKRKCLQFTRELTN